MNVVTVINPTTGKTITVGGRVYNRLIKEGYSLVGDVLKKQTKNDLLKSKSAAKKSPKMKDLYLITQGSYDGYMNFIPILAAKKADVGIYIRNNVEKVLFMFEALYWCSNYGEIREKLEKWYGDKNFYKSYFKNKDVDYKRQFINDIQKVLNSMGDEEIVNKFWGYNKDPESSFVRVSHEKGSNVVEL